MLQWLIYIYYTYIHTYDNPCQVHVMCSPVRVWPITSEAITSHISASLSGWIVQVTVMEYVVFIASSAVIIITRASVTEEDTERIRTYLYIRTYVVVCTYIRIYILSRLTVVSREAKKKQAVRDERVCYLQVAPIWISKRCK